VLTVNVDVVGLVEAMRYLRKVDRRLNGDRDDGLFKVVNRISDVWLDNFRSEGARVGGWSQLADSTRERRGAQGFNPEHPILERSGALRSATIDAFTRVRSNRSFSKSDSYSNSNPTTSSISISNGTARLNARGWKVLNHERIGGHEARPIWFVDKTVMFAAQGGLVDWVVNDVLTP
jgi:hypothetical protein